MWSEEKIKSQICKILYPVEKESREYYQEKQKRMKSVPRESIENE